MEVRLLGPVELWSAGKRVDLGTPKQRRVLAVLAWSAGMAVPLGTLIDHVWDDAPPRDVRGVLYTHVARLRRALATTGGNPRTVLRNESGGYLLDIARDTVDAHRFRTMIEAARRAPDDAARSRVLRDALSLRRDVPLHGITGQWANSVRTSLEQLHLNALADRIDLDLRSGHPGTELIDELTGLLAQHPVAERLVGQLMLALYRSGRSAEALTVFERLRKRLSHELGSDPGPELQRLHQQVLQRHPALQPKAAAGTPDEAPPRQLPIAPATFVGRTGQLRTAVEALTASGRRTPPIVAIYGPGGFGKSALALRAAHECVDHYPDGQLYIDLQGASPGLSPLSQLQALGRFLRALGVPGSVAPTDPAEAAARLRTLLADRRTLLMLDNAADAEQVRALLPATGGCGVLITSRTMLSSVDDAVHIRLGVLEPAESNALLARLDPTGRLSAAPHGATQLAALCGHLPLALRITAARMSSRPAWPLDAFIDRLADEQQRLDQLGHRDASVRASFHASYQSLEMGDADDRAAARAFRLLGLPDGPDISLPIAAKLLDLARPLAESVLEQLTDAQLLDSSAPGRYRMHDLLRLYARELAEAEIAESDRYAALERTWRCYVATAAHAAQVLRPGRRNNLVKIEPHEVLPLADRQAARDWLEQESPNLIAAASQAMTGHEDVPLTTVRLAHALFGYMHVNHHWSALRDINLLALKVTRARGDRPAEGQVLNDLGVTAWRTGDGEEAVRLFSVSRDVRRAAGDVTGEAFSLFNLATARQERGEYATAASLLEEALAISRDVGYRSGEAMALQVLADVNRQLGLLQASMTQIRSASEIYRELGDSLGEAHSLRTEGANHTELGQLVEAVTCFEQALQICREWSSTVEAANNLTLLADVYRLKGDLRRALSAGQEALTLSRQAMASKEEAMALCSIGRVLAQTGQHDRAREHWHQALPILERLGAPSVAEVRQLLRR